MNIKDFGSKTNLPLVIGGLLMIIGIGLGTYSIGTKLFIIALIVAYISSLIKIIHLNKVIRSLKNGNQQPD